MSTDRLSDEVVRSYATEAYGPNHHPHLAMLAREVQERRQADAPVAPATPSEFVPSPVEGPHDHKGYSEEKCVRCGWVMGGQALNCMNDDTPHVFPSQLPVAPVGDEPNPYRFTLKVEWSDVALDWVIVLADSHERMFMEWACPTDAEAREHARLIAAALRTVEVEQ